MNEGQLYGRGIAFPPRVGADGRIAWSEGVENIRESIRLILLTEFEERVMLPKFGGGLKSFLFQPNTVATRQLIQQRAERALIRWEPRIRLTVISVEAAPDAPAEAVMTIEYRLAATSAPDRLNLVLRFAS